MNKLKIARVTRDTNNDKRYAAAGKCVIGGNFSLSSAKTALDKNKKKRVSAVQFAIISNFCFLPQTAIIALWAYRLQKLH